MKKSVIFCFVVIFLCNNAQGKFFKEIGFGPELVLNIPLVEPAIGVRAHMHLNSHFFIAPQVYYFPGLSNINELYMGVSGNLKFWPNKRYTPYVTAGGLYQMFINHAASPVANAQLNNVVIEAGGGITKNFGCWRPFLEYRVNAKWWESFLTVGILYYFKDCKNGGGRGGPKSNCPAFSMIH